MPLDLNDTTVIYALTALDTDLKEFHYKCMELGPFFKLFFHEFTTDAHRKGLLQEKPKGGFGFYADFPAHVSHNAREYWKPQIEQSQILAIHSLFSQFQVQWRELYSHFNGKFYSPQADASVPSPWTPLNTEFVKLATNICAICSQLTDAPDEELPRNRVTVMLGSLAQLSESDPYETLSAPLTPRNIHA